MKTQLTTLCYIEKDECYLMLHRISKANDINHGKWIGIGGHFEKGESPEDCLLREVYEETGLVLNSFRMRGIVTFVSDDVVEYMFLFTSNDFSGELIECNEGKLAWIAKSDLTKIELWEGDLLFLDLLKTNAPFFSLKLVYECETLQTAFLDGKKIKAIAKNSSQTAI